jgi:hypothetical protein
MQLIRHVQLRCGLVATILCLAGCVVTPTSRQPQSQPQPYPQPQPQPARPIGTLDFITGPNAYYVRGNVGGTINGYNGLRVYEGGRILPARVRA